MTLLAEGFGLGLSTGLYCLGACAPLLVPFLLAERRGWAGQAAVVAEFLAGRLAAYLSFAAVAGAAGAALGKPPPAVLGAALAASGAMLVAFSATRLAPRWSPCAALSRRVPLRRLPLALGLLSGINVCPPFVAGLVRLVALGSVPPALAYFSAFFAGTALFTLPAVALAPLAASQRLRSAALIASVASGVWFAAMGLALLVS